MNITFPPLSIHDPYIILLGVFGISLLIQLLYYLLVYYRMFGINRKRLKNDNEEPVSVIICAKNEALQLKENLPYVLDQNYPEFEVIVVNDSSTDNTDEVLYELKTQYPHLRYTSIEKDRKFTHNKKLAITVGVKASKYEWLLFIEPDVKPASKNWINFLKSRCLPNTSMVLGYSTYPQKGGILHNFVRFDALYTALQFFSFAKAGIPFMGSGRNMAYRKSFFFDKKGFSSSYHIYSGDDELFINQHYQKKIAEIEVSKEAKTVYNDKHVLRDWVNWKKRHYNNFAHYKKKTKLFLLGESFTRVLFYASLIVLLCLKLSFYVYLVPAFVLRLILQYILIKFTMDNLSEKNLLLHSPLYDLLLPLVNFSLFFINLVTTAQNKWK